MLEEATYHFSAERGSFSFDSASHSAMASFTVGGSSTYLPSEYQTNGPQKRIRLSGTLQNFSRFSGTKTLGFSIEIIQPNDTVSLIGDMLYVDIPDTYSDNSTTPLNFSFIANTTLPVKQIMIELDYWNGSYNDPIINYLDFTVKTSMIPASGAIHFNDLCDASFQTRNTRLDLNNAFLRSIANKLSGQIAMSDLYGK